jgi:hypothetical protein
MKVKFKGIASGDHEAFCWDVSREEFTRLTGMEPKHHDRSFFRQGYYRIYPGWEVPDLTPNRNDEMSVNIETTDINGVFTANIRCVEIKWFKSIAKKYKT